MTTPTTREELIEMIGADALAKIEVKGILCVPVEATEKMIIAGAAEYDPTWGYPNRSVGGTWAVKSLAAMLAASPFAPERSEG